MDEMKRLVLATIREFDMVRDGDTVVVGLSGGADSVCLLALLTQLSPLLNIRVSALHVHHGLRGEEADRDGEFSRALCAQLSVPFHMVRVEVRALAARQGLSEEEAARLLRYQALEEEARRLEETGGRVRVAVAHHRGDQAETILHNICRGSGLAGLRGMPFVRGRLIRPLLQADRRQILAWLQRSGLPHVEDSTNRSAAYTRNRIRASLLPALEEEVNGGAAANLLRLGRLASEADDYLRAQGREWIGRWAGREREREVFLPLAAFAPSEARIVQSYGVMELLRCLAGSARDLGQGHVESVLRLAGRPVAKQVDLPQGLCAERTYEGIRLSGGEAARPALPGLRTRVLSGKNGQQFPQKRYTKWFDCDKIKNTPVVRTRQPGDYITLADGGHKTIARFMIDEKIPRKQRDEIPLLADGSHIMWVVGLRVNGWYEAVPETAHILEAEVYTTETEDKIHGRQNSGTADGGKG